MWRKALNALDTGALNAVCAPIVAVSSVCTWWQRQRDRLSLLLLRLTTWRKRRDWKRKNIPEDPYPMNGLTPLDHLILSKYAEDIR